VREQNMKTIFGKHLAENPPEKTVAYELKFTSKKSIWFDALKEHQREALKKVESVGLYHKITDQPVFYGKQTRFHTKKPFDCFFLKCRAYVVVWFYEPRQPKTFYAIRINDFLEMESASKRKSFTEDIARQYSSELIQVS